MKTIKTWIIFGTIAIVFSPAMTITKADEPFSTYWYDLEVNDIFIICRGDAQIPSAIGVKYTNVGDTPVDQVTVHIHIQRILTRKWLVNTFAMDVKIVNPGETSYVEVADLPITPMGLYKFTCYVQYAPGRDTHPLNNVRIERGASFGMFWFL
jgi:hypothetical protein